MSGPSKKVTDFFGQVKAIITEDANGKKTVTDWTGKVLGTSDARGTRDFLGNVIASSDSPELLVPDDED